MDEHSPLALNELLENGSWVRSLARELLYDQSLADDVVQEVWITALQRPPREPRALQAWLKKIVRTFALRANRATTRQRRNDELARRVECDVPSSEEVCRRLELQSVLGQAVRDLDEPYRTVVYLRYFQDLRLVEIAARLGVPSSTVRTRLARGLEQLRSALDGRFGGRSTWSALLIPLALGDGATPLDVPPPLDDGTPRANDASALTPGVKAFALAVLVAALATSGALWSSRESSSTAGRPAAPDVVTLSDAGSSTVAAVANVTPRGDTAAVETVPAALSAPSPAPEEPHSTLLVVDRASGRGIDGARVFLSRPAEPRSIPVGRCDARGALEMSTEALCRDSLIVVADGWVEHREPASLRDLGGAPFVVELDREFTASARVLLPDGAPAAGVPITIGARMRGLDPPPPSEVVHTGADGRARFVFRHYEPTLLVELEGYAAVHVPARAPETLVRLDPGRSVRGRVRDASGAAVAGCLVEFTSETHRRVPARVESDDDGAFELGVLAADDDVTLTFHHPELPSYRERGRAPADGEWVFTVPAGAHVTGRVVGPDGEAAREAVVFVMVPREGPEPRRTGQVPNVLTPEVTRRGRARFRMMPLLRALPNEDGAFELGPLVDSSRDACLFVHHPTFVNRLERLDHLQGRADRSLRLERGTTIRGRVVGPRGEPRAGVLLHLGEIWSNDTENVVGRVRSGADGEFEFVGLPARTAETLLGSAGYDAGPVQRIAFFVAAFPPDVLLACDGIAMAASPVWNGFAMTPGADDVEIVAATRGQGATLNVSLRAPEGAPVRTLCRALVVEDDGVLHEGLLGPGAREAGFHTDHSLDLGAARSGLLVLAPEGYRWREVRLEHVPDSAVLDVFLSPLDAEPTTLTALDAGGAPLAGRELFVAYPTDAEAAAWISLGVTDELGTVDASVLEEGDYRIAAGVPGAAPFGRGRAHGARDDVHAAATVQVDDSSRRLAIVVD